MRLRELAALRSVVLTASLCAVLLAGCGATGQPAPATRPDPSAAVAALIPGEPWYRTEAAARAAAVSLLESLPAYPGARAITAAPYAVWPALLNGDGQPVPRPAGVAVAPMWGPPLSADVVDLYRAWSVPAPAPQVLRWVQTRIGERYPMAGTAAGDAGSAHGVEFTVVPGGGAVPVVAASVVAVGRRTLVRYDAQTMYAPPRPADETLPPGARAVSLVGGGRTVLLTAAASVARLVALVNGLPRFPAAITTCPPGARPWQITLRFSYAGGRSYQLREGSACGQPTVSFGTPGAQPVLADPDRALLTAARSLLGLPPSYGEPASAAGAGSG